MIPGSLAWRYRWALAWMSFWTFIASVLWLGGY